MTIVRSILADYSIVDEYLGRFDDVVQHTPYWVLILITCFLFAIFIYGLVKRLVVFSVIVALLIVTILGIWFVVGHSALS